MNLSIRSSTAVETALKLGHANLGGRDPILYPLLEFLTVPFQPERQFRLDEHVLFQLS